MKKRAQAVLTLAVLAAGSAATAMAAEPPLQTPPLQQEIWITGTVQRSAGQFLSGNPNDPPIGSPYDIALQRPRYDGGRAR
jgi:hypothetical protein